MNYDNSLKPEGREFARENNMWEMAKLLVDIAVKAQMTIYDVDQETACDWVVRAAQEHYNLITYKEIPPTRKARLPDRLAGMPCKAFAGRRY